MPATDQGRGTGTGSDPFAFVMDGLKWEFVVHDADDSVSAPSSAGASCSDVADAGAGIGDSVDASSDGVGAASSSSRKRGPVIVVTAVSPAEM